MCVPAEVAHCRVVKLHRAMVVAAYDLNLTVEQHVHRGANARILHLARCKEPLLPGIKNLARRGGMAADVTSDDYQALPVQHKSRRVPEASRVHRINGSLGACPTYVAVVRRQDINLRAAIGAAARHQNAAARESRSTVPRTCRAHVRSIAEGAACRVIYLCGGYCLAVALPARYEHSPVPKADSRRVSPGNAHAARRVECATARIEDFCSSARVAACDQHMCAVKPGCRMSMARDTERSARRYVCQHSARAIGSRRAAVPVFDRLGSLRGGAKELAYHRTR